MVANVSSIIDQDKQENLIIVLLFFTSRRGPFLPSILKICATLCHLWKTLSACDLQRIQHAKHSSKRADADPFTKKQVQNAPFWSPF